MSERDGTQLHAYEITPDDAAFIRMMAGARFGPGVKVTLPSGKTITGAEMQRWIATDLHGPECEDDKETGQ